MTLSQLLRDRIQKLEEHLMASKKRLSQLKMGKAGLRYVISSLSVS